MASNNPAIWTAIHRSLSPWDSNALTLTRFSHVSKAARQVFTSDLVWDSLNVYNVSNIFEHFFKTTMAMAPEERKRLRLVWALARTNGETATARQLMHHISNGLKLNLENLYEALGFIVATAFMPLRRDVEVRYTVANERLMRLAVQINPMCIIRIDSSLQAKSSLYKLAYGTSLGNCDLGDLDFDGVINDFFAKIFRVLPDSIRYNRSVLKSTLRRDPQALSLLPTRFQHNVGLVLYALSFHGTNLADLPEELRTDREFLIQAIILHKRVLLTLPTELLQDRAFLLAAFAKCHTTELDGERIIAAIENAWVDSSLNEDFEVMFSLVKWCGLAIRLAGKSLKNDGEIREAALGQNGLASQYVDCTRSEALTAVKSQGDALEFLGPWSTDREVVSEAMRNNSRSQRFSNLQEDIDSRPSISPAVRCGHTSSPFATSSASFEDSVTGAQELAPRGRQLTRFVV